MIRNDNPEIALIILWTVPTANTIHFTLNNTNNIIPHITRHRKMPHHKVTMALKIWSYSYGSMLCIHQRIFRHGFVEIPSKNNIFDGKCEEERPSGNALSEGFLWWIPTENATDVFLSIKKVAFLWIFRWAFPLEIPTNFFIKNFNLCFRFEILTWKYFSEASNFWIYAQTCAHTHMYIHTYIHTYIHNHKFFCQYIFFFNYVTSSSNNYKCYFNLINTNYSIYLLNQLKIPNYIFVYPNYFNLLLQVNLIKHTCN